MLTSNLSLVQLNGSSAYMKSTCYLLILVNNSVIYIFKLLIHLQECSTISLASIFRVFVFQLVQKQ